MTIFVTLWILRLIWQLPFPRPLSRSTFSCDRRRMARDAVCTLPRLSATQAIIYWSDGEKLCSSITLGKATNDPVSISTRRGNSIAPCTCKDVLSGTFPRGNAKGKIFSSVFVLVGLSFFKTGRRCMPSPLCHRFDIYIGTLSAHFVLTPVTLRPSFGRNYSRFEWLVSYRRTNMEATQEGSTITACKGICLFVYVRGAGFACRRPFHYNKSRL